MNYIRTAVVAATAALAVGGSYNLMQQPTPKVAVVPANHYGEVIDISSNVGVRKGCRLTQLGVAPYLAPGMSKDAQWEADSIQTLLHFGLPLEAAVFAVDEMRKPGEQIAVKRNGAYRNKLHTSYAKDGKRYACLDSELAFPGEEQAERYVITHEGMTYILVVFTKCGNISLLTLRNPGYAIAYPILRGPAVPTPIAGEVGEQPPAFGPGLYGGSYPTGPIFFGGPYPGYSHGTAGIGPIGGFVPFFPGFGNFPGNTPSVPSYTKGDDQYPHGPVNPPGDVPGAPPTFNPGGGGPGFEPPGTPGEHPGPGKPPTSVPEPGTLVLSLAGLATLIFRRKHR